MITISNRSGLGYETETKDENGKSVENILSMQISIDAQSIVKAELTLVKPILHIEARDEYIIQDLSKYPTRYLKELKVKLDKELENLDTSQ